MAITLADFNKIWASTSPLTPYSFSESNYKQGWNFIGSTPPARQMWDFLQKNNDEKMQYLANNYLPLSGGTLTGNINSSANEFVIKKKSDDGVLNLWGGTNWSKGSYMGLFGIDHAQYPGWFRIYARNSTTSIELRGKPDGTLTWNGNNILTASNYENYVLPLSGGTLTGPIRYNNTGGMIRQVSDDQRILICGGSDWYNGADLILYGKDNNNGRFDLVAKTDTADVRLTGTSSGSLTWGGKNVTVNSNIEDITMTVNSTNVGNVGNYNNAYRCGCVVTIGFNFQIKAGVASDSILYTGLPKPKKNISVCLGSPSGIICGYINTSGELKLDGAGPSSIGWANGCITYITVD